MSVQVVRRKVRWDFGLDKSCYPSNVIKTGEVMELNSIIHAPSV